MHASLRSLVRSLAVAIVVAAAWPAVFVLEDLSGPARSAGHVIVHAEEKKNGNKNEAGKKADKKEDDKAKPPAPPSRPRGETVILAPPAQPKPPASAPARSEPEQPAPLAAQEEAPSVAPIAPPAPPAPVAPLGQAAPTSLPTAEPEPTSTSSPTATQTASPTPTASPTASATPTPSPSTAVMLQSSGAMVGSVKGSEASSARYGADGATRIGLLAFALALHFGLGLYLRWLWNRGALTGLLTRS